MASLAPRTRKTLEELEAALASSTIPPRIARSCQRLVEKLRRPIRVGLIGFETEKRRRLLAALLRTEVLPGRMLCPTLEIGFAEQPYTRATLADASTLAAEGYPQSELLDREAVFLQIGAPLEALRRVTFLHLAAGEDAAEQAAALRWAARRIDFAIWGTRSFSPVEDRIWNAAPPELKNHAYLVAFASKTEAGHLHDQAPPDFERVFFLPGDSGADNSVEADAQAGAQRLLDHLAADIDNALGEDLDAARLLLHRCGQRIVPPKPDWTPAEALARATMEMRQPDTTEIAGMVDLLSEPLIFLRRQARHLFEAMEWQDRDSPDWVGEVLDRCCEVTDGLRDRAAEWPEDEGPMPALRRLIDDASDMATLLQIEGGPEQAEDAAALLLQLRTTLEASLARPSAPLN